MTSLKQEVPLQSAASVRYRATALELCDRFPPRVYEPTWTATEQTRPQVQRWCLASPLYQQLPAMTLRGRVIGLTAVLDWLERQPGSTWQERWLASGAGSDGRVDWRTLVLGPGLNQRDYGYVGPGLLALICADAVRPGIEWLLATSTPRKLTASLALTRDTDGMAALAQLCTQADSGSGTTDPAMDRIAIIMAAKGGTSRDISVGDCVELLGTAADIFPEGRYNSPFFYQLLHSAGVFPLDAPGTIRTFLTKGQLDVTQMIDRYGIECPQIRDILVDYLRERRPRLDYATLLTLSSMLGNIFWRDIERHHPGIDSLRLDPQVARAWKQRLLTRPTRSTSAAAPGSPTRINATGILATVRSFYLDLGEWAAEEPSRWGQWAVPSPIRAAEISHTKELVRRKSRMDQRTRQRIPALPALAANAAAERDAARLRLDHAVAATPGDLFTADGVTLRRTKIVKGVSVRIWAQEPDGGARRDLTLEEHQGFWAWASVEVLRHSGIRIEELTELSHHSLIQYKVPGTGELVPLLHIAPSKTDTERLLVVSPELADVLSSIICRVRDQAGAVPLVTSYDEYERLWNPPMPLLFQRRFGTENRPIPSQAIRKLISIGAEHAGITDADGRPLAFTPHDFRRIFVTDAIMHGMPPHIAQLVVGHKNINTTMGYKAVYPEEVLTGHRAFIARRREQRPSQEYRTPTDAEWEEFLGHFERRKLSLGTCGRAYNAPCIHEHSCIRCPLLRPDPEQRPRLTDIRDNLIARLGEARDQSWLGEVEGIQISLAAAEGKLTQMQQLEGHRTSIVDLGMPIFGSFAGSDETPTLGRPATRRKPTL